MIGPGSTIGIIGGGQLGRMLAIAAAQLGYRCHIFDPHEHPCAADVAACVTRAPFDDVDALRQLRRLGRRRHLRVREFAGRAARVLGDKLQPGHPLTRDRAGPRRRESSSSRTAARGSLRGAGQSSSSESRRRPSTELGAPARPENPPLRLRRQGPGVDPRTPMKPQARGKRSARSPAIAEAGSRLHRGILGDRRAVGGRASRLLGFARERASRRHSPPLDRAVQRLDCARRCRKPAKRR